MKFFMQPQVMNENLKNGLGRWVPVIPQIVKDDPWWLDTKDGPAPVAVCARGRAGADHRRLQRVQSGLGSGQRRAALGQRHADVIKNGMTPAQAVDKAFKRAEAIFAKFTFG